MITSFSTFPLRLAVWLGFLVTLIGIFLFAFVILAYFFSSVHVPGFTFLAAGLTLFSGTQLFVLGVLGEYLARMYMRSMGCPAYVIRERI
jgi:undecaprenyl-phosphate 4-deoxy-4-formamido-L-arabinose transferase